MNSIKAFIIFLLTIIAPSPLLANNVLFGFFKYNPCPGAPVIGSACSEGAVYAGYFDSGNYMVTPSGCTDSATPTCAGGTDTVKKTWRGSTGSDVDIAGVENIVIASFASSSSYRGHVNTPAITADASTSSDSAADYCSDMTFGGYDDWYLPSKSELAYIYCHSVAPSHAPTFPNEEVNCVGYGGKTSELTGFATTGLPTYWSSTENSSSNAYYERFDNGIQASLSKLFSSFVRCVRRY